LRAFSDWVDSHPDHARIWLEWGTAIRQDIWQRYLDAIDWYVDLWSTAIEKGMRQGEIGSGLAPDEMARLIVGSGQVIAQMKFARSDPETVDRYIRALVQAVIGTSDA
jgi:TetR/AcrR family hemagglutinin/protease transcriptional regulator